MDFILFKLYMSSILTCITILFYSTNITKCLMKAVGHHVLPEAVKCVQLGCDRVIANAI